MQRRLKMVLAGQSLLTATILAATPASSQGPAADSGAAAAEDIVVTARRREETLLDVPIALSAVSDKTIAKLNVTNLIELQAYTPGLYTQQNGSGRVDRSFDQIIIRGIADDLNATTTIFMDGAPVANDIVHNIGGDIQRVEVLKGPQSALYGRQTFAGAINVITRDPGNAFGGYVDAQLATYSSYDLRASLEAPIVRDRIALRVGGRVFSTRGQYDNVAEPGNRLGDQKTQQVNATLVVKPFEDLRIKAFVFYLRDNDGAGAGGYFSQQPTNLFTCNAGAAPTNVNNYFCGKVPRYPLSQLGSNVTPSAIVRRQLQENSRGAFNPIFPIFTFDDGLERREFAGNLNIDLTIPGTDIVLSSLTSYNRTRFNVNQDLDGRDTRSQPNATPATAAFTPEPFINYPDYVQGYDKFVSQEFRIASGTEQRFRWLLGVNYYMNRNRSYVASQFPFGLLVLGDGALNRTVDKSVFGSVSYDIGKLTINAEARYLKTDLRVFFRVPETLRRKETFKKFAPRVTVQYKFTPDAMVYATYSRGINKGGFNLSLLPLSPALLAEVVAGAGSANFIFAPATLENYELGFKGSLFDRLTVAAAAFYGDWKDQAIRNNVRLTNGTTAGLVTNVGASRIRGAEIEGSFRATDNLTFNFNAGYSKVALKRSVPCVQCISITGRSMLPKGAINPAAPRFTSNVGLEYGDALSGDYRWFARVDYTHRSKIFTTYENIAWIGEANKVNLRGGITSGAINAQLFVTNLFNEKSYNGVSSPSAVIGGNAVVVGMPIKRTFGGRVRYNF